MKEKQKDPGLVTDREISLFPLSLEPSDKDKELISKLNSILERMGGSIKYEEYRRTSSDNLHRYLVVGYTETGAKTFTGRNAGRNKKMTTGSKLYSVGEVRQMLQERNADEVAAELGISRSTLFRRLKGQDDDRIF